ncbi:MAG TPA: beta-galactosidase [Roseiflexaceae bacterium]|nr:beta-galactosidase [Roseiflexaceae bacterium]
MIESSQLRHMSLPAELPYFAVARDDWELLLLRARQLGANTIAAPVPWAWHALAPERFDFDGATDERRDLLGFVRQCGRFGLQVLLDPGPRHDGLLGAGVPAWLLQQHPAARALGPDGAPWLDAGGLAYASALHPEFLRAARAWIEAFSIAMRALQGPSGPIGALSVGATGTPDRPDHNSATGAPRAPADPGEFVAWYEGAAAATTIDWLRADGWSIPLRRASPRPSPTSARLTEAEDRRLPSSEWLSPSNLLVAPTPTHTLLDPAKWSSAKLLRTDGSARPDFWRVKIGRLLTSTADADTIAADAPADLALASASRASESEPIAAAVLALAQRLRQANVAFSLVDLEAAAPQELAGYALIVVPSALAAQPAAQQKLAQCANIILLAEQASPSPDIPRGEGDLARLPKRPIATSAQISADISADQLAELIEERGGIARYAWADGDRVDLAVRYGDRHTYLSIENRRSVPYNGILAYRGRDGAVLHLHTSIGAGRAGLVLLTDDEVYGAAIDGDGAEGGWLARGLRSSAVFNSGAGALARCGEGLILTASQSGRFQARRAEGWADLQAYRLLISGALLPAQAQIDNTHIAVAYVAEDGEGQTDMYLVLPPGDVPPVVRDYLATALIRRAAMAERAAALARNAREQADRLDTPLARAAELLATAAKHLTASAERFAELEEYRMAWAAADELCLTAADMFAQALAHARGTLLLGTRDPAAHEALEQRIARMIRLI